MCQYSVKITVERNSKRQFIRVWRRYESDLYIIEVNQLL